MVSKAALKLLAKAIVSDLAETRHDDGSPVAAMRIIRGGRDDQGHAVLDEDGGLVLRDGEELLGRADFVRCGVAVLYAPKVTSDTRRLLLDYEGAVDLTLTNERVVVVIDDLSTKGRWDGDGFAKILAVGANVVHAVGSNMRHRGEAAVFDIGIEMINRVKAPDFPTFSWAKSQSLMIGWQEQRNLAIGDLRIGFLDQPEQHEHLNIAQSLIRMLTAEEPVEGSPDWSGEAGGVVPGRSDDAAAGTAELAAGATTHADDLRRLRVEFPKEIGDALDQIAVLSSSPHHPAAWLAELCTRIKAGSDPATAAPKIPLTWRHPSNGWGRARYDVQAPGKDTPISPSDLDQLRRDFPREVDAGIELMASLSEPPHYPRAWLTELCTRTRAGSDPAMAAKKIPATWRG